jgi:hypothetical protein
MTDKKSKRAYNSHIAICKFIHSSKENPQCDFSDKHSSSEIFSILIKICEENERLKKRIENLEKNNIIIKRKSIDEYLSANSANIIPYSVWMKNITISEKNLNLLFSSNLVECLKHVLEEHIEETTTQKLPMKTFTQKQNTIYIFENEKWRVQTSEEFKQLISVLSHRVLRKYLDWKIENETDYEPSEKTRELHIEYMNKVNGFGKTFESRVTELRKWMFGKIQISLKNIDF